MSSEGGDRPLGPLAMNPDRSATAMWNGRHVHRPAAIAAFLILSVVLAACSSAAQVLSTVGSSIDSGPVAAPGQPLTPAGDGSSGASSGSSGSTGSGSGSNSKPALYDVNTPDLQIIKTGTMSLQVDALDSALAIASEKISAMGGYVSGSQRQGDADSATATVTYRIPATQWDGALVALRGIATKVLSEQTQTQDVTGQIVDLGARITNLEATETALQAIILKATKIPDVLAVQTQLTEVRGEIEQATADRKHLTEQAAFSTMTVTYSLKVEAVAAATKKFDPGSEVDRASASLVDVGQALETAGIWFGIVWLPILLGLATLGAIVVFVLRRILRPRSGPGSDGGPMVATPTAEA